MSKSAIQRLDVTEQVQKRSQWEAFEFSLLGDRSVEVRNQSYPDEEIDEHTYTVELENGDPSSCDCPYAEYHEGDCKHMAAVAIRRPLIEAAAASEKPVVSDGGVIEEEACPNGDPLCDGPYSEKLPCFPCYLEAER